MDPNPQVLIAEEPPKPKIPIKIFLIVIAIILMTAVPLSFLFVFPRLNLTNPFSQKTEPKLIKQGNISELSLEIQDHPKLFYADLEYDPKTGVTTQLTTGTNNGDPPPLLPNKPKTTSSSKFIYKVEVTSGSTILQSGWVTDYMEIIQTPEGKLNFRVTATYYPKAFVKVFLSDNQLIWTGRIPE